MNPKPPLSFGFIICAALAITFGAVKRNHFFRLYTVAASSSILFAAFIPLAFNLFMPVKFINVPHTGSTVLLRFRFITFAFMVCCLALALSNSALYILCCTFFVLALSLIQVFLIGQLLQSLCNEKYFLPDVPCHHLPPCHFLLIIYYCRRYTNRFAHHR